MAVRKNPDWHVWAGDALYWIRTPPGLYVSISLILGIWLMGSLNRTSPPIPYSAPVYVPSPPSQPQQAAPVPPLPITQSDGCPPGTLFVQHLNSCITGHRRTTDIFVPGTKNNCPEDAIFSDRMGHCTPMYSVGNYTIYPSDVFYISNRRGTYLYVRSGQLRINYPGVRFNTIQYPSDRPIFIRNGAMIAGVADSSRIRIEFDAAPH